MVHPSSRSLLSDLGAETWSGLWVLRARQMKTLNVARAAFSVRHCCSTENRVAKQKTLAKFQKTEKFSFVQLGWKGTNVRIFFGNMMNWNECNLTNSSTKLSGGQEFLLIFLFDSGSEGQKAKKSNYATFQSFPTLQARFGRARDRLVYGGRHIKRCYRGMIGLPSLNSPRGQPDRKAW